MQVLTHLLEAVSHNSCFVLLSPPMLVVTLSVLTTANCSYHSFPCVFNSVICFSLSDECLHKHELSLSEQTLSLSPFTTKRLKNSLFVSPFSISKNPTPGNIDQVIYYGFFGWNMLVWRISAWVSKMSQLLIFSINECPHLAFLAPRYILTTRLESYR